MNSFLKYYESIESRPIFETVEDMLKWAGLYNLTTRTLQEELVDAGLSPLLIQELVTVRFLNNFCTSTLCMLLPLVFIVCYFLVICALLWRSLFLVISVTRKADFVGEY